MNATETATPKAKTPKRHGVRLAPVSKVADATVKELGKVLDEKESLIYAAGVAVFNGLTMEQKFEVLGKLKIAHAKVIEAELAAEKQAG